MLIRESLPINIDIPSMSACRCSLAADKYQTHLFGIFRIGGLILSLSRRKKGGELIH